MEQQVQHAEDDSPFLSMADFFSLISLTVIYIVIAFSPQSPLSRQSVQIVSGVATASGPAADIDNRITYVSVLPNEQGVLLRVVSAGHGSIRERVVDSSEFAVVAAEQWLLERLNTEPVPEEVVFYFGAKDRTGAAHRLFHELVETAARHDLVVSMVFLETGERSPL